MNRLGVSTSPYLLQHKDNPVDWWEWSDEAFAEARRRDLPILLSVGYAACHWCHVMAHESFENEQIAQAVNANFVAIKVDREERPDIDAVYMSATTALTGSGGWPMTCLLTSSGEPFFCGTYFPPDQFRQLVVGVGRAWREDRDEVLATAQRITSALAELDPVGSGRASWRSEDLAAAVQTLARQFDAASPGFGSAPKFPPSMVLQFLLRHHQRTGDEQAMAMAGQIFEAMARGGIYDQLAGGFARYSVDAHWVVPHFEKMLYDNAQLLAGYVQLWRRGGSPLAGRVARETADFLLRELATAEGGFASALDADTEGVEGLTYVWTPEQLERVLGDDAGVAAELFEVTEDGTFEGSASTLQLRKDAADERWFEQLRFRLLAARKLRPQPSRDDKIVTAWNGLAIGALAEAAMVLAEPRYLDAAVQAARFLARTHWIDGRLRRASLAGQVSVAAAVSEDYGDLAEGLLMLFQATSDETWLDFAGQLLQVGLDHCGDGSGGFYDTTDDAETLMYRPRERSDNAAPSGNSALASALVTYGALTGSTSHLAAGAAAVDSAWELARSQPRFFGHLLAAAEALADGPVQIAIVGEQDGVHQYGPDQGRPDQSRGELTALAWRLRPPGAVIVSGSPNTHALLADRPLIGGRPAAYVCRGMVCDLPVTEASALADALAISKIGG